MIKIPSSTDKVKKKRGRERERERGERERRLSLALSLSPVWDTVAAEAAAADLGVSEDVDVSPWLCHHLS